MTRVLKRFKIHIKIDRIYLEILRGSLIINKAHLFFDKKMAQKK